MILLWRRFWPTLLLAELLLNIWLAQEQLLSQLVILLSPLLSLITAFIIQTTWWRYTLYWQRLLLLIAAGVGINSLLHTPVFSLLTPLSVTQIFPTTLTGGILLTPFVYLIHEYLREQHFRLIPDYGIAGSAAAHVAADVVFCSASAAAQRPASLPRKLSACWCCWCLSLNVFMAYRYGWQAAYSLPLLGSLIITFARQFNGAFADLQGIADVYEHLCADWYRPLDCHQPSAATVTAI